MFCCNAEDNFTRVVEMHAQNKFSHSNVQERLYGNIKLLLCKHGGFMVRNFALIVITMLEYNFLYHKRHWMVRLRLRQLVC